MNAESPCRYIRFAYDQWRKVYLAMFNVFIDDSGTAKGHKVAIAACVIIPVSEMDAFGESWEQFRKDESFEELHVAECVARNPKSEYARWDDDKVARVLSRARKITLSHALLAFSSVIKKDDYDELLTDDLRLAVGKHHYSWAVSSLLGLCYDFSKVRNWRLDYIFDNADGEVRQEIEDALGFSESIYPGNFAGRYAFRKRREYLGLQLADSLAWHSYQAMRHLLHGQQINGFAVPGWEEYISAHNGTWLRANLQSRESLAEWIRMVSSHEKTQEIIAWKKERAAKRSNRRKKKNEKQS